MSDSNVNNKDSYIVPDILPEPDRYEGNPYLAGILGISAAFASGVIFFVATRLIYIYILYNSLLGLAIGRSMSYGIKQSKYTNKTLLFIIAALCSFITYLVFNIAYYLETLSKISVTTNSFTFYNFLWIRAQYQPLNLKDSPLAIINIIIWMLELGFTCYCAWQYIIITVHACHIEAIPQVVREFMIYLLSKGYDREYIRQELSKRGWYQTEDQERAFQALNSIIALSSRKK